MDKGISPLIAAVFLIALVIAIASMAGPFLTDFFRERTEDVEETGESTVDCIRADFDFDRDDIEYETDDDGEISSDYINVTIHNGPVELFNFNVYHIIDSDRDDIEYEAEILYDTEPTEDDPLRSGSRAKLVTDLVDGELNEAGTLEEVRVSTGECRGLERTCEIFDGDC